MSSAALNNSFRIPPGEPYHLVEAQVTFAHEATLLSMNPHMHLRGKSFEYRIVYPTGESEVLLRVPRYDFNWQLTYELAEPNRIEKGTRIECTAYFDNSANNRFNPEPTREVQWGDQTWEEMMIGWMGLAFDAGIASDELFETSAKPKPHK
jgi:hypothetical protein